LKQHGKPKIGIAEVDLKRDESYWFDHLDDDYRAIILSGGSQLDFSVEPNKFDSRDHSHILTAVFYILKTNKEIKEIKLKNRLIDFRVATSLGIFLQVNQSLRVLDLHGSNLGPSGAEKVV